LPAFDSTPPQSTSRTLRLAIFGTSLAWFVVAQALSERSARGITERFGLEPFRLLLSSLFLLFLLSVGFSVLQAIARRSTTLWGVLGLPKRQTAGEEWKRGAAIGWGMVVLAVLPMALAGTLHVRLWTQPRAFWLLLINIAGVAVAALAQEVVFRGYPYRRLIEAIGPVGATIVMSILFGLLSAFGADASWTSFLVTVLAGIVLSVAWLRTHGLWLGWGLHFGWNASMGILFGLPVSGATSLSTVVQTRAIGSNGLTGGEYGPEGALFTALALLVGLAVLIRVTRDYEWSYTHPPIIPGGYPLEVAPPPAHVAMEQEQQAKAPALVQILPATPQSRSAGDESKL
jgi:membrane protease YdiL (CAAX protease family)